MTEQQTIDLAITGAHILTIDQDMTEILQGTIFISGDHIEWIGPDNQAPTSYEVLDRIDATGKIIIPTFFNGHNHAAMSILRGLGNDLSLDKWLNDFIWPAEKALINPSTVYLGTMLSAIEMIKSGSGAFSDMYFFEDEVARVCEEVGIRGILGEAVLDFPTPSRATPQEALAFTRQLTQQFANHPLIQVSIALHAPYTCSPDLVREAADLSKEINITAQIHVSETLTEIDTMATRYGKTPVRYLYDLGFLHDRTVVHHAVHLTSGDIDLFRETGISVMTLPNSNMKLGSGSCSVSDLHGAGLNVGIGTDGPASNNNLSMVRELQQLARLERVTTMDPTCLPARLLIRMATINGAKAYHLEHKTGSLECGKKADFQIINPDQPHWYPNYDSYNSIAYAMHSEDVETVIINGKLVMKNRILVNVDEGKVLRELKKMGGKHGLLKS